MDSDINQIIAKLLEVRGSRPGKQVNLSENEIKFLIVKSREIFMNQPCLLELEAPIKICGTSVYLNFTKIQVTYTDNITIF